MITNFEEITEDLTEIEIKYIDVIKGLIRLIFTENVIVEISGGKRIIADSKLSKRAIKQPLLCELINNLLIEEYGLFTEIKMNPVRLRKYFSYFRCNGLLPIIATSDGCYLSEDKEEIGRQIKSLEERARSIQNAAEGMKKLLTI